MRISWHIAALVVALCGGCSAGTDTGANTSQGVSAEAHASSLPRVDDRLVDEIRHALDADEGVPSAEIAARSCGRWMPVDVAPDWCAALRPPINALVIDSARLQEAGHSIAAAYLATAASEALQASGATGPELEQVRAFASQAEDMFKPLSDSPDSDEEEASLNAELIRYNDRWERMRPTIAAFQERNRDVVTLYMRGTIYNDAVAIAAARNAIATLRDDSDWPELSALINDGPEGVHHHSGAIEEHQ